MNKEQVQIIEGLRKAVAYTEVFNCLLARERQIKSEKGSIPKEEYDRKMARHSKITDDVIFFMLLLNTCSKT